MKYVSSCIILREERLVSLLSTPHYSYKNPRVRCEGFLLEVGAEAEPEQQSGGVDIDQQQTTDERVQLVCCPSLGLVRDAAGCT